jgi:hypothetical protein
MNELRDVREAQAMVDRTFAGKREPVNLSSGRRGGVLLQLLKKVFEDRGVDVDPRPAYRA